MPDHEPTEFRYFKITEDFPAKAELENVLGVFIDRKRDELATSDFMAALYQSGLLVLDGAEDKYPDLEGEDREKFRDYLIWQGFDYSLDDLSQSARAIEKFAIERAGDDSCDLGYESQENLCWSNMAGWMTLRQFAMSLTVHFTTSQFDDRIACQCWIRYIEGDADEVVELSRLLAG